MMLGTIGQGIEMIYEAAKKENGKDFKLQEGDTIAGVFNDGIIELSMEDGRLGVNVIAGEPYKFDFNLDLTEEVE